MQLQNLLLQICSIKCCLVVIGMNMILKAFTVQLRNKVKVAQYQDLILTILNMV